MTNSTVMEATLDDLRTSFPNQFVVGFEEMWDERGDQNVDLGPPDSSLKLSLQHARVLNPNYKLNLQSDGLLHVYPARGTADPARLLEIRIKEFRMPPDHCIRWAIENLDRHNELLTGAQSYAPELSEYLIKKTQEWYGQHGRKERQARGVMGGGLGACDPDPTNVQRASGRRVYRNVTVREALNLMARRSLKLNRREEHSEDMQYGSGGQSISWKFRFRRDPNADTGLGGVPVFQTF